MGYTAWIYRLRTWLFLGRRILCFDMCAKLSIIHGVSEARFFRLLRLSVLTRAHGVRQETALLPETITDAMRYKTYTFMKLQKDNRFRVRAAKARFSRAAFTLMEVLLAIAMISMLAFIVVVNLDKTMSESQTKITESFVNGSLQTPLMTFKLAVGRYPTTEEGLKALLEAPEAVSDRWKGPYVRNLPADPWGNPYQYRCPAVKSKDGYDVWSSGPDGKSGTEDDIGNW